METSENQNGKSEKHENRTETERKQKFKRRATNLIYFRNGTKNAIVKQKETK